jgi:hypothetical protein
MAAPRQSSAPLRKVERVQFGLLSPEEIIGTRCSCVRECAAVSLLCL